jgi:RimJ/RimL family protein N-acetyltransferase
MPLMLDWTPRPAPDFPPTKGRFVRVEAFRPDRDGSALFAAVGGAENDVLWRFIPLGPFASADELTSALSFAAETMGWRTLVFRAPDSGTVLGTASYMRIRPEVGSAEVGCVVFSPALQRTAAATEAMYMMACHLFDDLGYRRYEWKCNNDNLASRRAAQRLGFTFEGVFRQDMVVKGRNRDTAWFSMLDGEWPRIRSAFKQWLAPENFDAAGRQLRSLAEIRGR